MSKKIGMKYVIWFDDGEVSIVEARSMKEALVNYRERISEYEGRAFRIALATNFVSGFGKDGDAELG